MRKMAGVLEEFRDWRAVLLVSFFVLVVSCSASASCQHQNTNNTVIS